MKTRVVRYWYKTDWLYRVDAWRCADGTEIWFGIDAPPKNAPKAGEWYWAGIEGALSRDRALGMAAAMAEAKEPGDVDCIAEFGS